MAESKSPPPDPLATFPASGLTPVTATNRFARMATPEPRRAKHPAGTWSKAGDYEGRFRLAGGHRDYRLAFTRADRAWRVYQLPMESKSRETERAQIA